MEVLDKLVMPFLISLLLWKMCAIIVFGYQIPSPWLCLYPFSYICFPKCNLSFLFPPSLHCCSTCFRRRQISHI